MLYAADGVATPEARGSLRINVPHLVEGEPCGLALMEWATARLVLMTPQCRAMAAMAVSQHALRLCMPALLAARPTAIPQGPVAIAPDGHP